jgi:hypothetical protein
MNGVRHNCWNHVIPSPQEVVRNGKIKSKVENLLDLTSDMLGLDPDAKADVIDSTFSSARNVSDAIEFEQIVKRKLVYGCDRSMMHEAIRERSSTIFGEIVGRFRGHSLLDVGCGNGLISQMSKPHFAEVQMLDVVNYVSPEITLPYLPYKEGEAFPVSKGYDTVLLLTVLHHSNDPMTLLKESWKTTNQRLIIIESVFGVHVQPPIGSYELAVLEEPEQIAYAVFVDWLYNRVLNDNIPVPYNFTTPERWLEIFVECGMHVAEIENLGQDIKIAPELHYMFVLER